MGITRQKILSPDSQIAQDLLEQTEVTFQGVRKMPCKFISKTKRIMIKKHCLKIQASRLRLRFTAISGSPRKKNPFTVFWWIRPYIIEMVLPNNIYFVRKIGTNQTQVLH